MADPGKIKQQAGQSKVDVKEEAARHYMAGNRFYRERAWQEASGAWNRAAQLWLGEGSATGSRGRRFLLLRAGLAMVVTVLMVHLMLYLLFPRNPLEMMMLSLSQDQSRNWFDRFMETGRPQPGDDHKMSFREWWSRLRDKYSDGGKKEVANNAGPRTPIPEKWAELLRRYGRWGDFYTWNMDYTVISGHGLSQLGDYDTAIRILKNGIKETRDTENLTDLYQNLANAHYYKGYQLQPNGMARYDLRQVSLSAKAYEESLKLQPRPLSHGNLGWMYYLLGNNERSIENSLQALKLNSNLHYVRLNLGLVYLVENRLRDAFQSYLTVIRQNPGDEVFLGGITDLREVLRDNPAKHPFANMMIGLLAIKSGDLSLARNSLTRYLAAPGQNKNWRGLATSLLKEMDTGQLER